MKNDIQIFNSPDFGSIRTVVIDGVIWFVAKDLAEKLGYAETANMRKIIDNDDYMEIDPQSLDFTGFVQNGMTALESNPNIHRMLLINESGLYSAILGSTLPNAKKFKRWVTSEVLPQIRKTGSYNNQPIALPQSPTDQIRLLAQGHVELAEKVEAVKSDLAQFKDDCPLFPVEAEQIVNAAKKKGVDVMGGKESDAYHDRSLVQLVYRDLYSQIHRNFQINTYKALRRGQLKQALDVIDSYQLPIALSDKIKEANAQISLF